MSRLVYIVFGCMSRLEYIVFGCMCRLVYVVFGCMCGLVCVVFGCMCRLVYKRRVNMSLIRKRRDCGYGEWKYKVPESI